MMDENSAGCASEGVVETVARAMYDAQAARTRLICPAWDAAASEWKREWRGHARAAIAALPAPTISQDVPAPAAVTAALAALKLCLPIVEDDYALAVETCDADWEGMSKAALDAARAALSAATPLQSDAS